jgi:DNA polymerase alpha subunit B
MEDNTATDPFNELFSAPGTELPQDVLTVLQSITRIHSFDAQELFYKWESYCLKMGSEETKLDYETAQAFKKDVQEKLEQDNRGKHSVTRGEKRGGVGATPRNIQSNSDVFGMYASYQWEQRIIGDLLVS